MTTQKPVQTGAISNWFSVPVQAAPAPAEALGSIPTRRRALTATAAALAGAAAVNLGAIAVSRAAGKDSVAEPLLAPSEPDPILAAIEDHRAKYFAHLGPARRYARTGEGEDEADITHHAMKAAREALAATVPTTLQGALALIRYVSEFNDGAIALPDDKFHWASSIECWWDDDPWDFLDSIGVTLKAVLAGKAVA